MKRSPLLVVLILILTACSSSDALKAAETPETVAASPMETSSTAPTDTPNIPTKTATEAPTNTPEPAPDLRVIIINPRLVILSEDEIDPIAVYGMFGSVPNYEEFGNVINPYANLACMLGQEETVEILKRTGLVSGWTTQ